MSCIDYPANEPLTQGMIFSCALAEDYALCDVHGLIITARCDAFNDKVPIYNYVPVVLFDDWVVRDAAEIIASRAGKAAFGDLKNALNQAEQAPSLLEYFEAEQVYSEIFHDTKSTPARNFKKAMDRYQMASSLAADLIFGRSLWAKKSPKQSVC